MPKRYPLPEDEPQFPSPSPQSAASSGQAAAETSRELLKGPDMTDVPSPTSSVEDFRKRVDAGVEGVSPSWQTAARSGGRMGAQASKVIANTLADQQDTEAKLRTQQQVQQQRDAERLAKETAKAAEDQARKAQAIEARTAAAAGAETEINIENGRSQAKRDAEGNLVFKPGPVGDPRVGIAADVSQRSSGILGGDGAIGASGGSAQPAIVQDFRDSSGRTVAEPVKPKTDPKTGLQTVAMKDSFGREVSQTVGIDPKIAKLEDLARRKSMLDLQRQQLEFNEAQVGPSFHDAASKADTAAKKLAALTTKPKFVRNGSGQWVHITDEGRTTYPDPMAVAAWESEVKAAQTEAERLGAAKAKVAPQWEGLQQQKAKLAKAKLDLAQEEVATKWGISPGDSTLSNAISKDDAMQAGMSEPIDFQSAADPNVPPVPTADPYEALLQGAAEASKGAPLLESVAMTSIDRSAEGSLDAARKVLAPFVAPENLAIGQSGGGEDGKGFFLLMNKGGAIGTVTHDAGGAYIELNPGTPNYEKLVNLDTKSGVPVYLGVNTANRKNPAQTAEWAKQLLSLVDTPLGAVQGPNGEIVEGSEDPRDTPAARAAALRDLGGGLDQISHAASVGEIPIQVAESLAQRLYGASIKPTDPNDKALFAKWLAETSRKEANARLSTNELTVGERFAKGSFTEKNAVRRQFIGDWYAENRGKPGVTRSKAQAMMAEDLASGASLGEKASSAAKKAGDMALNDVGASMLGLIGGVAKDVGAAEVALFGSDAAAAELKKSIQLRNRDFASWTNTANRNRKIWFTGYGQAKAQKLDQAVNELRATIDAEHDSPEPDKAKIDAAERAVRFAALELHQMAPDEDWPITEESLDPSKDAALGNALARYIRSADPNEIAVYKERLLMGNGRRQFSAEMEKLTAGKNRFFGAFSGASQAGWQEVGTELAGDALMIASGAASKGLQMSLQAAGKVGAATRIARLGTSLSKGLEALDKIGTTADSLVTPLTKGQRITNTAVGIAKTGVKGFVSEGMEEVTAELGSESPKFMDSFLMGGFGGIVLTPAFHVAGVGLNRVLDNAAAGKLKAADAKFASRYNAEFADTPGFQPITPEQASVARGLVNNSEFESIMAEAAAANQAFRVAQAQAVGTVAASTADPAIQKSLDNLRAQREKVQAAMAAEGISPDRLTMLEAQDSQMAEQEANLAGQIPDQSQVGSAIDRLMQARQQLDAAFARISEQTVGAVDAINEINGLESPDKQTYYRGIAKVATGNEASLTQNERSAIGGAKTARGAAFFANAPDGRTVLTDEARAELRQTMPALGKLVKTTESEALFEAQVAAAAPAEPAPAAPAQPAPEVSIDTPPTSAEKSAEYAPAKAETHSPTKAPASEKISADPSKNAAAIEAADYQSFRSFEPSMPDIPTVVRNAYAAGNPVSISMANASGVEVPANYQQQGNMLVADPARQPAQPAENPKITQARKLAESVKARIEKSTPSLKGRIEILEEALTDSQGNAMASGGAAAAQDGQILVIIPDLVREIAKNSLESIDASLEQVILRHEAVHIAQYDAVRAIWEQQGKPGSFSQFFQSWYGKIASELPAEAMAAGRNIYGAEAWDAISSDANRAAELVRMLIEAKLDPAKADQFSELFRAVQVGYSPTLIETLKQAIATLVEMIRTGKLSKAAQQHLDAVEALYRDLVDAQPQATAETAPADLRIELEPDGKASVRDGDTILWRGPAERAEAALAQMSATDTPMQVTGQAIADAIRENPSLTAKSRAQLESIAEDLTDALESMPTEQRRAAMDAAISEWVASKKEAKKPKQRQLDAPARTIAYRILNSGEYDALTKLFQSGNKIAPRPNLISLILARKKSGAKLTNKEIRLLENNPEYDGASYQNQFANSGTAKVAREIIGLLMARQGEGTRPEVMAGYLGEGMTASDMWLQVGKELTAIANGQRMAGSELDPNRERTDADIQQELAKQEAEAGTTDGQNQRFEAANTASNGDAFHIEDFTPDLIGTTVTVDGEPMRVTDVQMDSLGNEAEIVVLDDHARFGRQVLANGDVVYLETEKADNVEDGTMFSSPTGNLRERINSAFNLPPSNYEWKPSNERRTSILEIAAANGIELVDSRNLSSATRDFQEATGAIPVFYRGGKPSTAGFVARSSPEVILINVEREDVPISWTLAHELTHVAQKDPAVDSLRLVRQIASLLTRGEMAQIEKYLTDAGYEESSFLSELPAFLIADAVTGQRISGFTEITKLERLNESLVKFFDEIPLPLKPEALRQAADDELSSPLAASPSVPPFYSQLQRTIEAKMPNIAPPAQVMQIAVSGAKAEEVKWSGLVPWLQGREKVSKADVLAWLANEGAVRFEEVIGRDQSNDDVPQAWETRRQEELLRERASQQAQEADTDPEAEYDDLIRDPSALSETMEEARAEWLDQNPSKPTRYAKYVLPGGENYREVVLAMPDVAEQIRQKMRATDQKEVAQRIAASARKSWEDLSSGEKASYMVQAMDQIEEQSAAELERGKAANYTSSHFPDVPNYVAHMRLNERTDAEGKPGLFIEELQSDRHQAGRKEGYRGDEDRSKPPVGSTVNKRGDRFRVEDPRGNSYAQGATEEEAIANAWVNLQGNDLRVLRERGVADAPYRKEWPLALFKRALRDAVAAGKEWIGWTVGETQNDRFDLSKQVSEIQAYREGDKIAIEAFDLNESRSINEFYSPEKLADVVGKDLAQKIIDDTASSQETQFYKGNDLKVGGSGMKGFYDNILPKEIGKYVKQWGGKVEISGIGGIGESWESYRAKHIQMHSEDDIRAAYEKNRPTPIHRIDITPEMRKGVLAGQALFASPSIGRQASFDFGTSGDFGTRTQTGFNFGTNTPAKLEGEPINKEWTAFSPQSGTLGIPRAEMPQIRADDRSALVQFLRARGVDYTNEEMLPGSLKPTQAEYSQKKVDKAREFDGGNRSILVSSDGYVVDGHHQWMAKLTDAPRELIPVIRLDAPIRNLLPLIGQMPSATTADGATAKDSPTVESTAPQSQPGQLTDFGRTLSVRKNRAASMRDITDADLASLPFSKIWPKSEVDSIEDLDAAALAHAVRSEVPRKPTSGYKLTRWVAQVKQVREIMRMAEEIGTDAIVRRMEDDSTALRQFAHKVRILQQIPREHWDRIGSVQNWPDAYRFVDGQKVPSPYATVTLDDRRITAASLDALVPALLERLQAKPADKKMQFEVRGSERTGFGINKKGDGLYRRLKTFETAAEALAYVRDNNADLVAAWEAVKKSDNVKESDLRTRQNRDRVGPDRRQGKPVTDDMFRRDFGFSGVAFGNWVQQGTNSKERQGMLNLAYDALMDLADVLGIPPRAVSLDGDLGLALGADGSGKFSAHYRPDDLFINLTKTRGAGTLAHEWFHALDHYFQRKRNTSGIKGNAGDYFTQKPEIYYEAKDGSRMSALRFEELKAIGRIARPENWTKIEGVRPAVAEAFMDLVKALDQSPMSARARLIDKGKSDGYWSRIIERAARSFENYVIHKMQQKGYLNDYLANVTPVEEFGRDPSRYPYLLDDEIQPVAEAFDNVFQTLDTKETDRGVMLLSSPGANGRASIAASNGRRLEAPGTILLSSTAYHGTPHKVDRFSLDKIGTGEGAQAYGWGLYFAQEETVARNYRDSLTGNYKRTGGFANPWKAPRKFGSGWIVERNDGRGNAMFPSQKKALEFKVLKDLEIEQANDPTPLGNLYTVTLDVNDEDLLDWDKPLSEQSEKIQKALSAFNPQMTGSSIYMEVATKNLGADNPAKAATGFMRQMKIPGIRFLDGNSRSQGQGSYNYVIFDESKIKITHENGNPVDPAVLLSAPSTPSLLTAAADPAKREKLSQVKIGAKSALGAYRTLTAKRESGKALTAEEEQTLLDAEQALGQKMAFDMEALSGPITADPQPPISRGRENGPARSTQQSMELGPETLADGQMTLLASPTLADITTQALASMQPIYRQVFAEVVKTPNADPATIAAKFGMSEKAVINITNQVRARVRALTEAASPAGLTPAMIGNQFNGGRPDLALSTNPSVAAVDQIRNQEQVPDVRAQDTVNAEASAMLAKDYEGTYNNLLAKARDLTQFTDTEVAAAKLLISRETIAGAGKTPEERMKLALLIYGYREVGTETARSLAMRRDPHQSPAERHAQYIAEALYTPDAATRERLRKAPRRTHESILAGWLARVDGIRRELKAQGVDIDASLAAFQQKKEASAQAQVDSPLVSKAVEDAFQKRTAREKMVIQAIREGATATGAARISGMTVAEIKPIWTGFVSDFRANLQAAAKRFVATVLASSPSSMFGDIEAQFGIFDWDAIDDTKPDFVDRRNEKPRMPRQSKPKAKAAPRQPASRSDMTLEEWANRPPQTWRTLFETEMGNLQPGDRLNFEEWVRREFPESAKSWQSEMDLLPQDKRMTLEEWATRPMQTSTAVPGPALFEDPKAPINETTGTFDLNDPKAVKAVMDAFALARGTKLDALMEFWRMSILSGPQTHIVNAASNTINSAYNLLPRRAAEATVNTLLGLIGQGDVKSAGFGEFAGMARALHKAVQGAARTALRSWELESHVFEAYATAAAQQLDFTGVGGEYQPPALGGKFGKLMRSISFRAMTAADEFQKRLYGELEAAAQAHRIAKQEDKLSGEAYTARVQELMQPGSVAWIRALDESKRITFQQEIDGSNPRAIARLDQLAELAKKGREMPYLGRPLTLFLPFINTPLNVFKQAVEMSPLGGFLAVVDGARALRRKIFRGELSKAEADAAAAELYDRTRLVRDLTNQSLGIMLYFALKGLTEPPEDDEQGLPMITGTQPYKSTKAGERAVAMRTMPPQSIRIGDTMFSYSRVEPFATVLAGMVDAIVTINRTGLTSESASLYAATFKDQVNDKTFLKGVSDLINAWEEPGRFAENLTGNIITGFIPNIIRQPIREMDSVSRDTSPRTSDGFFTSIAKKVGYSVVPQAAPVKMDVWGNPVASHRGEPLGGFALTDTLVRIVDPTNLTVGAAVDPIDRYIFNYNLQTADPKERLSIMPIDDYVMIDKKKVAITPEQQAEANRRAGKAARAALPTTWDWKAPTSEGIDRIKDAVEAAQRGERDRLRAEVRANQ